MINVALLGRMSLSIGHKRVALNFGSRGRLLAGFLFQFPGRVHRREQLGDMFWEECSQQQSRAALNTALWRLRRVLAQDGGASGCDCILSTGDEIVFEPSPELRVDTHDFDDAVRRALDSRARHECESRCASLEGAVARYAGSFLDGDEGDWVIAERERLHSLYVRCLCELMRTHAAIGDYESSIASARRVLAADPFRETVMRTLALLLFLNGQRAQAIDELARWQAALRAHIGVGALPETRELQAALVSGSICSELPRWRQGHLAPLVHQG
jgi:DNA-binding SARP family transcriptional activator